MSGAVGGFDQSSFEEHDKEMKRFRRSHPVGNWNTARKERAHCTGEADNEGDRLSLVKLLNLIPICGEVESPDNQKN